MSGQWFFHTTHDGSDIALMARFEAADGTVGDAAEVLRPGGTFCGLTYQALRAAGAGVLCWDGSRWVIGR